MKITPKLSMAMVVLLLFCALGFSSELGLKNQAQEYRQLGLEAQNLGDLDSALVYYQKAIQIDPYYVTVYNDLGIIYEALDQLDRAEEVYLRALKIDPNYLSLYSNLAMLYEKKKEFAKAITYWKKRAQLGNPQEAWTQKANERFMALIESSPELKKEFMEIRAAELSKDVILEKRQQELARLNASKEHFDMGLIYFQKEDYPKAIEEFSKSLEINPDDGKAKQLLFQAKEANMRSQVKLHYELGLKFYQQGNFSSAIQEFDKVLSIISEQSSMKSR